MNFQRFEENFPYVQLDVPEDSSKARFTVVMQTTLDIIKWFGGGKKIINISPTFGMSFPLFLTCLLSTGYNWT
jgi:hypothetical protein